MKKRPQPRRFGLNLFEKAQLRAQEAQERARSAAELEEAKMQIAAEVRETFTAAQIHALMGGDGDALVNKSGRMFFVVLGAAVRDKLDAELPDIRILRGACNAMYEQAGEKAIPAARRASIVSGLEACERLLAELDFDSVVESAVDLHMALTTGKGAVNWTDFQRQIEAVTA